MEKLLKTGPRPIEFKQACAIARLVILRDPAMTIAEWSEALKVELSRQGYAAPDRDDMLSRAMGAVERALRETRGPRPIRELSAPPAIATPDRRWTSADYRLFADTLKRIAARSAGATGAPSNVSPLVVAQRLDISEPAALDQFYDEAARGDRLGALRRFVEIAIPRPEDWDYAAVRAEKREFHAVECFGCRRRKDALNRHHVIQVQHGGSNYIRNIVALCESCHAEVHPWLPKRSAPRGDWRSLADIAPAALQAIHQQLIAESDAS